ncbi:MAG: ABC transporter ATP-binding protein [Acidilobaceae archaeon]
MSCSIVLKNVKVVLGNKEVLKGVTISFNGELSCLMGPNGAGKTTMLKTITGIVRLQEGEVKVCGREPREVRSLISYVPSHLYSEPFSKVSDVMRAYSYGVKDPLSFEEGLEIVGLSTSMLERKMIELSGGEQKLVLIAAALIRKPKVFLLDEPFSSLDLSNQVKIARLLRALQNKSTIIYTAHEPSHASIAQKVVVMKEGSVMAQGNPSSILRSSLLSEVYGVDFLEKGIVPKFD